MEDADYDALEKVSVTQWCRDHGLWENKTVFSMIQAISTLITTINDPDDIPIGDIFRYMGTVINPRFKAGRARWPSGFACGGIMRWSQAVANRFVDLGGRLELNTQVQEIIIQDGKVCGVILKTESGEVREVRAH